MIGADEFLAAKAALYLTLSLTDCVARAHPDVVAPPIRVKQRLTATRRGMRTGGFDSRGHGLM